MAAIWDQRTFQVFGRLPCDVQQHLKKTEIRKYGKRAMNSVRLKWNTIHIPHTLKHINIPHGNTVKDLSIRLGT